MTTHRRHSDKLRLIVKTGSVSGTVEGKMTVESVQDEFTSEGRGYSAGISAGIGRGFDRNNPKGYGVNLSSISAGHTRTDVEQRITRNVTEFTAGGGFLDVKGTVKQVGSLIDGNFTLNSSGYEYEDLKDKDKWHVQYLKGLGEMNPDQLWESTLNPATRKLYKLTIEDAEKCAKVVNDIMGKDSEARKKLVLNNFSIEG